MAGYSGKPVIDKLGLRPGMKVYFDNSPATFEKEVKPVLDKVEKLDRLAGSLDFIQTFVTDKSELTETFLKLKSHLAKSGMLWVSWPKGGSQIPTDLNENIIRELGLEIGLVDVKVIAVDEEWSALKFVFRLTDR